MVPEYTAIVNAVLEGDQEAVRVNLTRALEAGHEPLSIVNEALVCAMDIVINKLENNEIYVTDLIATGRAMQAGLKELRPYLSAQHIAPSGRVVIGTVAGDIHDIGKNLVALMLEASGYEVIDLGVDVSPAMFVEAIKKYKPGIVCLSALLSTTVKFVGETVTAIKEAGLRHEVKIMVGGGRLNADLAEKMGADAYAPEAATAVKIVKELMHAPLVPHTPPFLARVFTHDALTEVSDALQSLFGLELTVLDTWGKTRFQPPGGLSCSADNCPNAGTDGHISGSRQKLGPTPCLETLEGTIAYRCPGGALELAYPLAADQKVLGEISCGHFLLQEDSCPPCKLKKIPLLSRQQLGTVGRLLSFAAKASIELSQAVEKTEQLAEQLQEQQANFMHFIKRQHQLEEALRDAELKALQSQVNPHFLFNALNTVARLALLEGHGQTEKVVQALARLMRYSLYQVKTMVSVKEELQAVKDYLLIQEIRFQERLSSKLDVAEEVLAARMPCMILQPLVENACLHGIEPSKKGGQVKLLGRLERDQVRFEIADDGIGMAEEVRQKIFALNAKFDSQGQVSGLGIANVCRRLNYHFGSKSAFDIHSAPGTGTKVLLVFPLIV